MPAKPKIFKYIVMLPDGKEVMVKAHEHFWNEDGSLTFMKNGFSIMGFKEWSFWKKL